MKNLALIVTLVAQLTIVIHSYDTQMGRLSPLIAPTAFLENFYTCQFRVIGLDFPKYSFEGLPPPVTGSAEGRVSGTPNKTGSYPVTVSYKANGYAASAEFVFRVTEPIWTAFDIYPPSPSSPLYIYLQQNSTMFMAGDQINLRAACVGGKPPYFWTYLRMPEELKGDKNGVIRGEVDLDGSYSFGATCADGEGLSADIFITLNVQPMVFFGKYTIKPVYVQNKNPPTEYDWQCVTRYQEQTFKAYNFYFNKTEQSKIKFKQLKILLPQFEDAARVAQDRVKTEVDNYNNVVAVHDRAALKQAGSISALAEIKHASQIAVQNTDKVKAEVKEAQLNLDQKKNMFDRAASALSVTSNEMIRCQTQSSAAAERYQNVSLKIEQVRMEVDFSLNSVLASKKNRDKALTNLQLNNNNITLIFSQKEASQAENEQATLFFNTSEKAAEDATEKLRLASARVADIRKELKDMETQVGTANFMLQQAENQLFVAQAAKAEVDKLSEIAKTYQKQQQNKKFAGCQCLTYPSTAGSAQIVELYENGALLASGQTLLWGDCTRKTACQKNDLIYFQGFLKEGCLHAVALEVVSTFS